MCDFFFFALKQSNSERERMATSLRERLQRSLSTRTVRVASVADLDSDDSDEETDPIPALPQQPVPSPRYAARPQVDESNGGSGRQSSAPPKLVRAGTMMLLSTTPFSAVSPSSSATSRRACEDADERELNNRAAAVQLYAIEAERDHYRMQLDQEREKSQARMTKMQVKLRLQFESELQEKDLVLKKLLAEISELNLQISELCTINPTTTEQSQSHLRSFSA